jgi:hypothetical protein
MPTRRGSGTSLIYEACRSPSKIGFIQPCLDTSAFVAIVAGLPEQTAKRGFLDTATA